MQTQTTNAVTDSLVYLVAPRGGNNYWAVVINGTDKVYQPGLGTCAIALTESGRYKLITDPVWFASRSAGDRKLTIIHEAGHIALRHPERLIRMMAQATTPQHRHAIRTVFNIAADMAVNDSVLRHEPEFEQMRGTKEWDWLLPEQMEFPEGKSMEFYIGLLLKERDKVKQQLDKLIQAKKQQGAGAPGEGEPQSGEGDGEGQGQSGSGKPGKPSPSKKPKKSDKEDEDKPTQNTREALVSHIASTLLQDPDYFDQLAEAFGFPKHAEWNEMAEQLTPSEAATMAGQLRNHAKHLVRSAHEEGKAREGRGRGYYPGNIDQLVATLLGEPQTPWTWIFNDIIASAISPKIIEEMACPNLMLINDDGVEPWPGMALDNEFHIAWVTDTSGSMSDPEYARACVEFNGLLQQNRNVRVRYLECDAAIQKEMFVDNLAVPGDDEMEKVRTRHGYGGTVYTPVFKRLCGVDSPSDWAHPEMRSPEQPKRPDLVVVVSDGGVVVEGEVFPRFHPGCPIVWLITPGNHPVPGMSNVRPDHVVMMFNMQGADD
jgi:hypothetical protein